MSPEQAKRKTADKRADIWAFGCVLYEMLTGGQAFKGDTVGEVLADVFKTEPDWTRLRSDAPDGLRRLLRRCLQKDPKRRLHDMADARLEVDEAMRGTPTSTPVGLPALRRGERLAWISTVALVAGPFGQCAEALSERVGSRVTHGRNA